MSSRKREVTIYDIAEKLCLSPSTVSRGLRDHPAIKIATARRIQQAAAKMGYQQNTFASNLRRNRSNTVGLVVPRFSSPFQASVVSGVEEIVQSFGYNLIMSQSSETEEKEASSVRALYNSRADGLLISLASGTRNLDHLDLFLNKGIPVVLFDRVMEHPEHRCISVVIDNRKAGFDVTKHLIGQGCRRIVYVAENLHSSVYSDRYLGYRDALEDAGIPFDSDLKIITADNEGAGQELLLRLKVLDPIPDAVFCSNDQAAVSILLALKEEAISVPGEIAVAGFNDTPIARVIDPSLTTIHYPGYEMGRVAASTLFEILNADHPVVTRTIVLDHQLIVRASTKRKS